MDAMACRLSNITTIRWLYKETLEQSEVTDQLLRILSEKEHRWFTSCVPEPITMPWRQLALSFMSYLDKILHFEPIWLQAVHLFDSCSMGSKQVTVDRMLTRCAAAWFVTFKFTQTSDEFDPSSLMLLLAKEATSSSQNLGGDEVLSSSIQREELHLLKAVSYDVSCPTIPMWLDLFATRFNIATDGEHMAYMDYAGHVGAQWASAALLQAPMTLKMTPKTMSLGALSLAVVANRIRLIQSSQQTDRVHVGDNMDFCHEELAAQTSLVAGFLCADADIDCVCKAAKEVANLLRAQFREVPHDDEVASWLARFSWTSI